MRKQETSKRERERKRLLNRQTKLQPRVLTSTLKMQNRHQSFQICKKMKKNIQNKTPDLSFRCDFIINSLSRWHYLSRIIKRNRTNGDTFCQKFTSFFFEYHNSSRHYVPKMQIRLFDIMDSKLKLFSDAFKLFVL